MNETPARPNIYEFHDYRAFLTSWFAYLKATHRKFSLRVVALASGFSESYLSMSLSGARVISEENLSKMGNVIGLDASEQSYLVWLHKIAEGEGEEERLTALKKIQRFREYQKRNSSEIETYEYFTNWHYVAIREMATLPEFQLDATWVRTRLKNKIPLKEVRDALDFLTHYGFIERDESGKIQRPDRTVHAKQGVLTPALTKFHRQMLSIASDSISTTPSEERNISAYTASIALDQVDDVKRIMDEAMMKIAELKGGPNKPNEVYHFSFLAFPLTKMPKRVKNG